MAFTVSVALDTEGCVDLFNQLAEELGWSLLASDATDSGIEFKLDSSAFGTSGPDIVVCLKSDGTWTARIILIAEN
jgi:hypothetical protein